MAGLTGFSVQSAPNKTIEELVSAGRVPNRQISATTVSELLAIGVVVVASPGIGYHATVMTADPLSDEQASRISSLFRQRQNPLRRAP